MANGLPIDPDELDGASFELVRRGFDPMPVQRTMQRAAAALREVARERDALAARLAEIEATPAESLEAHRVAEALGVEATQVLEAAHAAAAERAERAEREAEAIRTEAIAAADASRAEAVVARQEIIDEAEKEAEAIAEDGRLRGRDMVNEAQIVRERMLGDLARKRQTGRAQVEQLRAGRDRLLESLSIAQGALDTAMKDLVDAVPEARAAAERAGMRIANEVTPTVDTMEAEIEAARLVGHPLVEGITDPGSHADPEPETPDPNFVTAEMEALTHVDEALEARDDDDDDEPDEAADDEVTADEVAAADDSVDADTAGEVADETTDDPGAADEPDDPGETAVVDEAAPSDDDASTADDEIVDEAPADEPDDDAADEPDEAAADDAAADEVVDEAPDDVADQPTGEVDADVDVEPSTAGEDDVDDLFARLREAQTDEEPDAEVSDPEDSAESEPEPAEEPEPEPEPESEPAEEPEPESAVVADPAAAVRARAESVATRALKKVLVEEQGTLLDGIRRSGGEAIAVVVADADAHAAPYEAALEAAFAEIIETLGGDPSARDVGYAEMRSVALDPVRHRLLEVADRSDDGDELSDTVRGLYRESRSRRLPMAAAAAVSAVIGSITISSSTGAVRWMVDPDGPCGPDCADNALAGPTEAGTPFPTGAMHPPIDPTCTCWLATDPPS